MPGKCLDGCRMRCMVHGVLVTLSADNILKRNVYLHSLTLIIARIKKLLFIVRLIASSMLSAQDVQDSKLSIIEVINCNKEDFAGRVSIDYKNKKISLVGNRNFSFNYEERFL